MPFAYRLRSVLPSWLLICCLFPVCSCISHIGLESGCGYIQTGGESRLRPVGETRSQRAILYLGNSRGWFPCSCRQSQVLLQFRSTSDGKVSGVPRPYEFRQAVGHFRGTELVPESLTFH